jgi:hypothetical protein
MKFRIGFLALPAAYSQACEKKPARVSSLSLMRYRGNDYSVPAAHDHREVLIRGHVHQVVIACAGEEIAPLIAGLAWKITLASG